MATQMKKWADVLSIVSEKIKKALRTLWAFILYTEAEG